MTTNRLRPWLSGLLCAAGLLTACALAQAKPNPDTEIKQAWQSAKASMQTGPGKVQLREQATLELPPHTAFIPQPAAGRIMKAMGNGSDERMLGLVIGQDADWMVVARYEESGYIRDNDAKDWNVDELFKSLKEGTAEANKERETRGIAALEITGWVERPHYDPATHRLIWSMAAHSKGAPADQSPTVNYNTYALGRDGYISLNLLTDQKSVEADKPAVKKLLANLNFVDGKRYADFNAKTDKVAEYGLAALVAGVAAKKLGLLAIIAAFAAKFFKLIAVAVFGGAAAIGKLFKRKKTTTAPVATTEIAETAETAETAK